MKLRFTAIAAIALIPMTAFGWGQKGHDTVASIAENHLTPKTRKAVETLLEGKSMIYWAAWLDNASNQPEYKYTKTWHYRDVDADQTYETATLNPDGDAMMALRSQSLMLASPTSSTAEKQLALKIIIHVAGDIHQPMHMGHVSDLGGNLFMVNFFGSQSKLHSVWDSSILESAHKWSHSEWTEQLDRVSKEQQEQIIAGNLDDWGRETVALAASVYDYFSEGCNISYDEVYYWTTTIEDQLLKGGLRLAHLLNCIFDSKYQKKYVTSLKELLWQ